ncbi:MAG TPA: alpha/beta fold hydrolase [Steroidobacteraceae bacterium]|nr:alpha/beta fold hydrolase [Steroidobacteraceae bacterium]
MKKRILLGIAALAVAAGLAAYLINRSEPADTRFSGAYALPDGALVFISPREGKVLRYRMMNGESGALWPTGNAEFEGGPGWAEREPVVNRVKFDSSGNARNGFEWRHADDKPVHARRIDLPERIAKFTSGDLSLRGKVVLPDSSQWGPGPFPAVVIVHGSEADSAVDYYSDPYIYAANGFAALAFDKRGTGESQGKYLQNFHVLSDDVVAAVRWLRTQPGIDGERIHLAGFSQGGWIAPLAALKDGNIRSVLVGYGVMVPVTGEDRWGYFYALQQKGFGADAVASADRINAVIVDIVDRHRNRWSELSSMLDAARSQPWFAGVRGSDSMLGVITDSKLPLWMLRVYVWWRLRSGDTPFIDRLYDPVQTMLELQTPSFWILGGEDSSAPTPWTLRELEKLQAAGRPVQYRVFAQADHGILRFVQPQGGERRFTGLEPDYYPAQIAWLREHSGS